MARAKKTSKKPEKLPKAERRQQILSVARDVFARRGYHQSTIDDIVAEAGVARGTFYLYFEDKRAVFENLIDRFAQLLTMAIVRIDPADEARSVAEQVRENIRRIISTCLIERSMTKILFTDAIGVDPAFDRKIQSFYDAVVLLLDRELEGWAGARHRQRRRTAGARVHEHRGAQGALVPGGHVGARRRERRGPDAADLRLSGRGLPARRRAGPTRQAQAMNVRWLSALALGIACASEPLHETGGGAGSAGEAGAAGAPSEAGAAGTPSEAGAAGAIGTAGEGGAPQPPAGGAGGEPAATCPAAEQPVIVGTLAVPEINEASGLAASRRFPGVFYAHNDSGAAPRGYALREDGSLIATLELTGALAQDWEDSGHWTRTGRRRDLSLHRRHRRQRAGAQRHRRAPRTRARPRSRGDG